MIIYNMQIFKNKKWITGIVYKDKGGIIISDDSKEAKAIINGHDFKIKDGNVIIKGKIKKTEKEKIKGCKDLNDLKKYLISKLK